MVPNLRNINLNSLPPKGEKPQKGKTKYNLAELQVGQAFDIPQYNGKPKLSTITVYTYDWKKLYGMGERNYRALQGEGCITVVRLEDDK